VTARPTRVRYVVLFGLCLAAGLAYIHRGCLSVVESTAREDLGLSTSQMGAALGAFFWAYALFQIPTGLLVDYWGPRRALFLFGLLGAVTVAMTAGTLWMDVSAGFTILLVSRLLMGIAQAGLFPASTRALSVWFPLRRRALAAGTLQACMSLGGAVGAFLTAGLLGIVDWPWVFVIYAVPGLLWSVWFFASFRDRPELHARTNEAEKALLAHESAPAAQRSGWGDLLYEPAILFLCGQQFFRAAAAAFWFTWCPTYLQNAHGLDRREAGALAGLPILGFMIGSIIGGVAADWVFTRTGSRRASRCGVAIAATFLGVCLFAATYAVPEGQATLAVIGLVAAALVVSGGNSCSYSTAMDLGGRNLAAVFGAMNMCGNFGAALFSQVAPEWVKACGWPAVVLLVGGLYFIGMLLWLPLNPDAKPDPERADFAERPER
jgi:MFS transporter, ACS family, D-galactonate transporter